MINVIEETVIILIEEYSWEKEQIDMMQDDGFLDYLACKKFLIKYEFEQKKYSQKIKDLKEYLSDKYCVSIRTVDSYIY